MSKAVLSLRDFNKLFPDEEAARVWFEGVRWSHGPECPGCGSVNGSTWMKTVRKWNCRSCFKQFTVTIGTVMHGSHLPLLTWAQAIYLVASSSKGISAVKLGEMIGVSYKTAWFLGHRIREMMAERDVLLSGLVEIDETYAGAPPRKKNKPRDDDHHDGGSGKTGRGTDRPMLLVAAERRGPVVTKTIPTHSKAAMKVALDGLLAKDAVAVTDGLPAYAWLGEERWHPTVTHSHGEYVRQDAESGIPIHVNRVESFNSFLGRAIWGVFHSVSPKHIGRYASECAFRWNRKVDACLARMAEIVQSGIGRSLSFDELVRPA